MGSLHVASQEAKGERMNCPKCGAQTQVKDSRDKGAGTRRRRLCVACNTKFTTIEIDLAEYIKIRRASTETRLHRIDRIAVGNIISSLKAMIK